jgi:hypothetical protein
MQSRSDRSGPFLAPLVLAACACFVRPACAQFVSHPSQVDNLPPAPALDDGETLWPQVSLADGTTFVLYSPQFTSIVGVQGSARAAFSAAREGEAPVYGSVTFTASLDNDLSSGLIHVSDMLVQGAVRADGKDPSSTVAVLQRMLMGANFTVQRSAVLENMDLAAMRGAASALAMTPPAVRVVDHAAVALVLDGPPVLRGIAPGLGVAMNTPSLLAFESTTQSWFTRVGTSTWLRSTSWKGPFVPGSGPAADAARAIEAVLPTRAPGVAPPPAPAPGQVPEVVVLTQPTVLVAIDGGPDLVQVADGIYGVRNAGCDLFTSADGNTWWLLASGRWFTTGNLMAGPWTRLDPASLPTAFARLDPKGSWGHVLASVPGTLSAKDAVYQQSIPHVATLDRAKARSMAKVAWIGGAPRFMPIDGTSLTLAANATAPVVQCNASYFLCTDGAWCVAQAPTGPWDLCDAVPESIYAIPASSPAYGTTFVRVVNATPQSVTFAFTAGYANSFIDGGVVCYGTGFATPGVSAADAQAAAAGGGASDPGDGASWGNYAGWPTTYACPMACGVTGWTCLGLPGWTEYALQCAPSWSAGGWWGPGQSFNTGFALGMGYAGAWDWGYHPWGAADADGWWTHHWSGAYRRGWSAAMQSGNRAANAGVSAKPPTSRWAHAAGADDDVSATPDGRVMQQRGTRTYARGSGGWQAASANAPGAALPGAGGQPSGFFERDGSAQATAAARATTMDDFRPDPNHDFDGSPRGAFARGETNYADRREALEPPAQGGGEPGDYRRGGSWNGGGYDRRDQPRGDWQPPQRAQGDDRQRNGYPGWSSGERGYGRTSGYTGARGVTDSWNHGWSRFGGSSDQYWRFQGQGAQSGYTGGIYYNSSGPLRSGYTGGGLGVNSSMFGWPWGWGGGMYGGNYRYGNFAGGMPMGIMR